MFELETSGKSRHFMFNLAHHSRQVLHPQSYKRFKQIAPEHARTWRVNVTMLPCIGATTVVKTTWFPLPFGRQPLNPWNQT